jgi:predicted dienelactone hydrolase
MSIPVPGWSLTDTTAVRSRRSLPQWKQWGLAGLGGLALALIVGTPGLAADRVYVLLGPFERSVAVDDLEQYAKNGDISRQLFPYINHLTPKAQDELRSLLNTRAEVNAIAVARFLYTDQGETLLTEIGDIIRTRSPDASLPALRSALILSAASDEGLTALNVLRHFPLPDLRIDLDATLSLVRNVETLINQTSAAINIIQAQAVLETTHASPQLPSAINPTGSGAYQWRLEPLTLTDSSRDRTFDVDLYVPVRQDAIAPALPAPVVVISHGLGSDRSTYAYLAEHLTQHGFIVAVIEHPGSNATQLQDLAAGRVNEVTAPEEFIDRPRDVSFLLDELEQMNEDHSVLQGRMNLEAVGIIGQSFGGYTALTLLGGTLNPYQLAEACAGTTIINLSLLLQCRALELPPSQLAQHLQDDRIQAAIAINPIGSGIIGPSGFNRIEQPVMIITGNADTIAPALPEQIRPFTWLGSRDKYLVLMQGATHFSTLGETASDSEVLALPRGIVGPDPAIAQSYVNALSVAFFQRHIADDPRYTLFLQAGYAAQLSQSLMPLSLVRSLDPTELTRVLSMIAP